MNTRGKTLFGVLVAVSVVVILGALFASAQMKSTNQNTTSGWPFWGRSPSGESKSFCMNNTTRPIPRWEQQSKGWPYPFYSGLTAEQKQELNDTIANLRQQNVTPQEIRATIQEKLDEFGVFDIQLDSTINRTQLRLTILNREKELRTQGYNWSQINTMIQQEFGQNISLGYNGYYQSPYPYFGGGCPPGKGRGFMRHS
jgi:hypothetical protein